MESPYSAWNVAFAALGLLAVGIAVVLARPVLRVVAEGPVAASVESALGKRSPRLVLWAIIGALLYVPVDDALRIGQSLPIIFLPAQWRADPTAATGWGTAPWPLYLILYDVLLLIGYGVAFLMLGRGPALGGESDRPARSQKATKLLLMGAAGGLLARFLQAIFLKVVWFPFVLPGANRGIVVFLLGWLLAAFVLAGVLVIMKGKLDQGDDELAAA